jgi:hypothetical protein
MKIASISALFLLFVALPLQAQQGKFLLNKITVSNETPAVKTSLMLYANGSYTLQETQGETETKNESGQLNADQLKSLKKTVKKAGVIRLQKKYQCAAADGAKVLYSFYTSSVAKKIQYQEGCPLPQGLDNINAALDGVFSSPAQ